MNDQEQVEWLIKNVPKPPDIKFLEQSLQTLALFFSFNKTQFSEKYLIILGLSGYLAMKARLVDEQFFLQIKPESYFQVAHYYCDTVYSETDANQQDFEEFLNFVRLFNINNS